MSLPLGLILAGGRGRRMGGADKALLPLAGRPLLLHAAEALRPQVSGIALSANGDPARFAAFGLPVLPDPVPGLPGPLAGIFAGLDHAAAIGRPALVSLPCDTPFPPRDLVAALRAAAHARDTDAAFAETACPDGTFRAHPAIALWPLSARTLLREALAAGRHRVRDVLRDLRAAAVSFRDPDRDPFLNINTPEELAAAEAHEARRRARPTG